MSTSGLLAQNQNNVSTSRLLAQNQDNVSTSGLLAQNQDNVSTSGLLAQNQDNVSTSGLLFQCYKNPTQRVGQVQSGHHHLIEIQHLSKNNNLSFTEFNNNFISILYTVKSLLIVGFQLLWISWFT